MEKLRTPLFVAALIVVAIAFGLETGSGLLSGDQLGPGGLDGFISSAKKSDLDFGQGAELKQHTRTPPGMGILYMALVDGLLLFVVSLQAMAFLVSDRVHGRIRGLIGLIVSFLVLVGSFVALIMAVAKLMLMIGLLLAFPFGTVVYMALFGAFGRGQASLVLSFLMSLKLAFAVLMVLAHQRFLAIKSLVLLTLTSLLCNIVISFLHALVPIFLVSITDCVAALICAVLALIWSVIFFVVSIIGIVKSVA